MHAPFGYEYLKIAEGCDNNCTFCIIPTIRGRQQSRPIESILEEVRLMLSQGIHEIQILSQDTTRYGTDLYGEARLIELLEKIDATIEEYTKETGFYAKFRVYYLYPDILTLSHLESLKELKHFLPYFDIPFQHASEKILKLMGRHYDRHHIDTFIEYIRSSFPDSFIRTSFIIGFPGETEEDHQILLDFITKYQFESVGIFQYHDEPLAASSKLSHKVDESLAKERIGTLTPLLDNIYKQKRLSRKNTLQQGYIMEKVSETTYIVRPELAAPEVDEYDEVSQENIQEIGEVGTGSFIKYTL
jgi:ribosomal protein S12 methylthiotransferase